MSIGSTKIVGYLYAQFEIPLLFSKAFQENYIFTIVYS